MNLRLASLTVALSCCWCVNQGYASCDALRTVSIVTGGSGFVGREIIHKLLQDVKHRSKISVQQQQQQQEPPPTIVSLVRPSRVTCDQRYWSSQQEANACLVKILPYDMLDGGASLRNALDVAFQETTNSNVNCCVYHTASFFGPSENHVETALDNVQGTEDVVRILADMQQQHMPPSFNVKLILTSSMAAVRGTNQVPKNGKTYTEDDWNTISKLGDTWGSSYQWSKFESERRAWELSKSMQVPMIALCPSFIFGPPRDISNSYSIQLVQDWIDGKSPVQSRLCVDVRDVARAHVAAAQSETAVGRRFLVSTDARIPSQELALVLQQACRENPADADNTSSPITYDTEFTGGAIPVGQPEVVAAARLKQELGITLRPVSETIADMARALLQLKQRVQGTLPTTATSKQVT